MFRVTNVEFIPEYRQEESHEFVSMANTIQHVVCTNVTLLLIYTTREEVSRSLSDEGEQRVQDVFSGPTLQADGHFRPEVPCSCSSTRPPQLDPGSPLNSRVLPSNNNKGGVLVHFWMVFVVPRLKSPAVCEECVGAIFRDSVHTSMKNRSSVGYLLGLPVDIDSILINGVSHSVFCPC